MTHDDTLKRAAMLLRESAHELWLSHSLPPSYSFESIAEPEIIADILDHRNLANALDALREELARQEPPFKCKYCWSLSWIDPSEQSLPPDYCHESDHGELPEQPSQVPEGWQLVPIEPTWEMIAAGCQPGDVIDNADMACAYKAMLAAAPQPKEQS